MILGFEREIELSQLSLALVMLLVLIQNLSFEHFDLGLIALVFIDHMSIGSHALFQIERILILRLATSMTLLKLFLHLRNFDFLAFNKLTKLLSSRKYMLLLIMGKFSQEKADIKHFA